MSNFPTCICCGKQSPINIMYRGEDPFWYGVGKPPTPPSNGEIKYICLDCYDKDKYYRWLKTGRIE